MKKLAIIIVVAIAGLVVFNYATTGELSVASPFSKSEEERAVQELWDRVSGAKKQFAQAYRAAAVGGIDTTADADAAISSIKKIKKELGSLRKKLTEKRARRKADELLAIVRDFNKQIG